jgi:hemolysin III
VRWLRFLESRAQESGAVGWIAKLSEISPTIAHSRSFNKPVRNASGVDGEADYDGAVPEREHLGDLLANAITHGVGALLAIVGAVWLIVQAARGPALVVTSCSVFACTLVLVYVCSTLYHSLVRTRARRVLQILDHSAIYLLIAGTYTPFTLVSLRGPVGWTIFGLVWGLAVAGVVTKSVAMESFRRGPLAVVSGCVYLLQGWLIAFAVLPLYHAIGPHGMLWLVVGGAAYTLGIVFFALSRLRYFHATWHLFVLGGSVAHYFAVLFYVAQ